jgi:signal transduction histidine kinase
MSMADILLYSRGFMPQGIVPMIAAWGSCAVLFAFLWSAVAVATERQPEYRHNGSTSGQCWRKLRRQFGAFRPALEIASPGSTIPDEKGRSDFQRYDYLPIREAFLADCPSAACVWQCDDRKAQAKSKTGNIESGTPQNLFGLSHEISNWAVEHEHVATVHTELPDGWPRYGMNEMAAELAHELNQPLAALVYLLGAFELLPHDDMNHERGIALVQMAKEQALRASEIIRRMGLAESKDLETHIVSVSELLDDAIAATFLEAGHLDIQLLSDLDPMAKCVLANCAQIRQVFINLLRNAMEELSECPRDGRILTIGTKRLEADMVEFSVSDTGSGIKPEIMDRLYVPFASTKGDKGMGLGLSISRRIIMAHGGTLTAANRPEGGATFRFTLPSAKT